MKLGCTTTTAEPHDARIALVARLLKGSSASSLVRFTYSNVAICFVPLATPVPGWRARLPFAAVGEMRPERVMDRYVASGS